MRNDGASLNTYGSNSKGSRTQYVPPIHGVCWIVMDRERLELWTEQEYTVKNISPQIIHVTECQFAQVRSDPFPHMFIEFCQLS